MFTTYFPELHATACEVLRMNREFASPGWTTEQLRSYQLQGLRRTLSHVKASSKFYGRLFEHVSDAAVTGLTFESFEQLPFTSKEDLRREMFDMLSKPLDECCFFYETTGTTGPATPCPRDYVDTIYNNIAVTSCLETILLRGPHRPFVAVCGPTELHSFGDTLGDVCKNMGLAMAKFWAYSPVIGLKKSLEMLRDLRVTAWMCTPGMALTTAKLAHQLGYDLKRDFALDTIMLTGELGSPAMIQNIGDMFGAKAYNFLYGAQEALVLGAATATGKMHTFPLNFYYEVIEPASGRAVLPDADGVRTGELVISMLFQGSKPMLRYRTGDFVRLRDAAQGDTLPSPVVEVLGRTRDALTLNQHSVYGYDLEQLLLEHARGVLGYQLKIVNDDVDRLEVKLDLINPQHGPELAAVIAGAFHKHFNTTATVTFEEIGAIGSTGSLVSWKAARIVDERASSASEAARLAGEREAAKRIAQHRDALLRAARAD